MADSLVQLLRTPVFGWVRDKSLPQSQADASMRIRNCQIIVKRLIAISRLRNLAENLEALVPILEMIRALITTTESYRDDPRTDRLVGTRLLADVEHLRIIFLRVVDDTLARLDADQEDQDADYELIWDPIEEEAISDDEK